MTMTIIWKVLDNFMKTIERYLEEFSKKKKNRNACRKIYSETSIQWRGNILGLKNIQAGQGPQQPDLVHGIPAHGSKVETIQFLEKSLQLKSFHDSTDME